MLPTIVISKLNPKATEGPTFATTIAPPGHHPCVSGQLTLQAKLRDTWEHIYRVIL